MLAWVDPGWFITKFLDRDDHNLAIASQHTNHIKSRTLFCCGRLGYLIWSDYGHPGIINDYNMIRQETSNCILKYQYFSSCYNFLDLLERKDLSLGIDNPRWSQFWRESLVRCWSRSTFQFRQRPSCKFGSKFLGLFTLHSSTNYALELYALGQNYLH